MVKHQQLAVSVVKDDLGVGAKDNPVRFAVVAFAQIPRRPSSARVSSLAFQGLLRELISNRTTSPAVTAPAERRLVARRRRFRFDLARIAPTSAAASKRLLRYVQIRLSPGECAGAAYIDGLFSVRSGERDDGSATPAVPPRRRRVYVKKDEKPT